LAWPARQPSTPVVEAAPLPAVSAALTTDAFLDVRQSTYESRKSDSSSTITVADFEPGQVVTKYATVSIDSLPIHHSTSSLASQSTTHESFTLVTRGAIGSGESLGSSLRRQGISPGTVHLIATEMRKVFDFRRSRPGDTYRLGQDSDGRVLDFRYSQSPEESFWGSQCGR
jgi:hypothetical protein